MTIFKCRNNAQLWQMGAREGDRRESPGRKRPQLLLWISDGAGFWERSTEVQQCPHSFLSKCRFKKSDCRGNVLRLQEESIESAV